MQRQSEQSLTPVERHQRGPSAQQVGHRQYDALLREVIGAVRDNSSREELLSLFIDRLSSISTATSYVVLELFAGDTDALVGGVYQKGVNPRRWERFIASERFLIPPSSLVHQVLREGIEINVWSANYYQEEFAPLRTLFDVEKGGWLAALRLPRATARHSLQGIFLWYHPAKDEDRLPSGAEQDWRVLCLFQHCFNLANYSLRKTARTIIKQRQELLQMLTPSILNHEIYARIRFFVTELETTLEDAKSLRDAEALSGGSETHLETVERIIRRVEAQLLPNAWRLRSVSSSVMGLTRRVASGPMNPVDEVSAVMELLDCSAKKANLLIEPIQSSDPSKEIQSDPALFMHIMVNLMKNAIDALDSVPFESLKQRRRIWTKVEWHTADFPSLPLWIDVCDSGPGVPADLTERIFEAGITTRKGGHGLGLAICRLITGYLGGELTLAQRAHPTVFRLKLPMSAPMVVDLEEELKTETEKL
jgi:signal transduction histidine kinase